MPAKFIDLGNNEAYIIIKEGKYHQVKRMFGTVGLGVNELHRESIGGLFLPESLNSGECIETTKEELESGDKY
jgi:16S rRNA pseudouridine516 synthase